MENKNAEISKKIITLTSSGVSIKSAIDTVLGNGAYLSIANSVYDSFKAAVK